MDSFCPRAERHTEEIAVSALANLAERQQQHIMELTRPKDHSWLASIALQLGMTLVATRTATNGNQVGGRRERILRAQLAADEARIEREAAEARAKLIAQYAPKLIEAQTADEEELISLFEAEADGDNNASG